MSNGSSLNELREVGNSRSQNSLVWAGFSLTNFVTLVAFFSGFEDLEITLQFQITLLCFLGSGALFAIAWSLYEKVGSTEKLKLAENATWYKFWRLRNKEKDKFVSNPRKIYIRQAEYCSVVGAFVWLSGVAVLLWDLQLRTLAIGWLIIGVVAWVWAFPRYLLWRK